MSPLLPPASNDSNSSGQLSDWSCSSSQSGSSSSSGFGSSYESTESNGPKERRIIAIGSNQCRNQKKSAQYTLKLPLEKHKENAQRLDRHELRATVSNESCGEWSPGSADVEERLTKKRPHPESEILYNVVRKKPKLKYAPRGKNISNYKPIRLF